MMDETTKNMLLPQLTEAEDVGCSYLTANDFKVVLYATAPGMTFVYFKGNLASDLFHACKNKSEHVSEMKLTSKLALEQSDLGSICLTQRLLMRRDDGSNTYDYCATKRKP
jgi:hypothetical protein